MPLSHNDITSLATLFESKFEHYRTHQSPSELNYLEQLKTAVGLGFTAIMVDGALVCIYEQRLKQFLGYFSAWQSGVSFSAAAFSAAEILNAAAYLFSILRYPDYYPIFKKNVQKAAKEALLDDSVDNEEEYQLLMKLLIQNC